MYDKDLVIKLKQLGQTWDEIGEVYDESGEKMRCWAKRQDWFPEIREEHKITNAVKNEIDTKTVAEDGKITSTIKKRLNEKKTFSEDELLDLHGMNADEFKIKTITSNEWSMTNADGEQYYNFQSKIIAEPKGQEIDWEEIGNRLAERVAPKVPTKAHKVMHDDNYLVKNVFDPHFGISTLEDYDESLGKDFRNFEKGYKEILIIAGGDQLHNDNTKGTTTSGTVIEKVDMNQAWEDCFDYFDMLIDKANDNAEHVTVMYIPGNHDEFSGWTVIKALKKLYREYDTVTINDTQEAFKAHLLGHNFIGMTHGDRTNKNKLPMIFATYFATLWGADEVYTREAYTGHLHKEEVVDKDGLLIRQAPTRNKADEWHVNKGFKSSHKRFLSVEYDEYEPIGFYYT